MLFDIEKQKIPSTALHEKFIVPPFSVIDCHQSYVRTRYKFWKDLGLCGTNGRTDGLAYDNRRLDKHAKASREHINRESTPGTSTFNPVVAEVAYKWFTIPHSKVYDPFAGGITRGGIAAMLGHNYCGVDLNYDQTISNYELFQQLKEKYLIEGSAIWFCGDSTKPNLMTTNHPYPQYSKYDFILTCPPYYNLEKYTDNPNDLSNAESYDDFLKNYVNCLNICYSVLKDDSFMVWIVSDVRDKSTTAYYGLVADTIKACQEVGFLFYNEIILYNDTGNLAIVSGDYLNRARKVGRQHQNILVMYKGNTKNIKDKFGEVC